MNFGVLIASGQLIAVNIEEINQEELRAKS